MDRKQTTPMTPFDNLVSTEQLQMMKLMLPYMPPGSQKLFAVYVKFLELQHTMRFFQNFHEDLNLSGMSHAHPSPLDLFRDIRPYMSAKDSQAADQMIEMFELFRNFQNMGNNDANPLGMMMGMLSPEQQNMFANYSELFSNVGSQELPGSAAPPDMTIHSPKGAMSNEYRSEQLDESSVPRENGSGQTGTAENDPH